MGWGCITQFGVGKILRVSNKINSEEYCNTLRSGLIETYTTKNLKPFEFIFQQDNVSYHTSAITLNWLNTNIIRTIEWPSNSPDLNPIENIWAYLNKKVRARSRSFDNPGSLWKIVEEEWYSMFIKKRNFFLRKITK
jgi:transposase